MPDPLQRILGLLGALLSLPLLAALAVAVRLDSDGPALYVATRVGEGGRPFRCLKLRTMAWRPEADGPSLTVRDDRRVTRLGRLLRRTRLDELPQLWNVARGEMRLVGPRPEDLRFVDFGDPLHRLVFSVRPGITGLAQLLHVDEASRLGGDDPERHYLEVVLPGKLRVDAVYLRYRSTSLDIWILARTPLVLFGKRVQLPAALAAEIATAIVPEA
jgi:lipopolysaccharide/colanic/teichoic acid biosynthesis glycosyltransferase